MKNLSKEFAKVFVIGAGMGAGLFVGVWIVTKVLYPVPVSK